MVTPDEEHDQYAKDPRSVCKFGVKCYQKNPQHHQRYKHPPKKRVEVQDEQLPDLIPKKRKASSDCEGESSKVKISNDISDSESESASGEAGNSICEKESEKDANSTDNNGTESNESSSDVPQLVAVAEPEPKQLTPANFDKKSFIKGKFLVQMPEDFYLFWDFCKSLNKTDPSKALDIVGLTLVGPYDVLADKFSSVPEKSPEEYLVHWRFYYDPPEFQTVIKGSESTGFHLGYFRDDPSKLPVFVASNHGKKDGEISCMGENIFAAVSSFLEEAKKSCDPFKKMSISKLQSSVTGKAEKLELDMARKTSSIRERSKKILVRSFNGAGLVVPYNRKTQLGYRHLCISDKELRKLLDRVSNASEEQLSKVMSDVQPVLTATSIATDECDFGTGVELGWNILAHGVDRLNSTIEQYLTTAYELLKMPAFAKIIRAHMKNRKKGTDLSIL